MSQDFLIMILEQKYEKPWNNGELWVEWYKENETHMTDKKRGYKFINNQSKEEIGGVQVVVFADMDVTIINHILLKVGSDKHRAMFDTLRKMRNSSAHGANMKISATKFEESFSEMFAIIASMFEEDVKYAEKWKAIYQKIRVGDIPDPQVQRLHKRQETIIFKLDDLCQSVHQTKQSLELNTALIQQSIQETKKNQQQTNERLKKLESCQEVKCETDTYTHRSMLSSLRTILQNHIRENLSTIPIPASTTLLDLSKVILNQSMRRLADHRNIDVSQAAVIPKQPQIKLAGETNADFDEYEVKLEPGFVPYPTEQDSDTESISSQDEEFVNVQFIAISDVISEGIYSEKQLILIVAAGGRGKTTAAKKVMVQMGRRRIS